MLDPGVIITVIRGSWNHCVPPQLILRSVPFCKVVCRVVRKFTERGMTHSTEKTTMTDFREVNDSGRGPQ